MIAAATTATHPTADQPVVSTFRRRVVHARDVVRVLVDRDLKVLYQRSRLGWGWALASPLLQVLIFTLIFRRVLGLQIENYASFAFIGVLVWAWFQTALVQSTGAITSSRGLVRQPGFPLALLPHVTIGVRLFHFLVALPILFILLATQGARPTTAWLMVPLLIALQFALIAGLAYPLAALNVRLRDTQHLTAVGTQLLMYLSPVFYSFEVVPVALRPWFMLNPMVPLLGAWRDVLLHGRWPSFPALTALAALATVLVVIGRRVFDRQRQRFVEDL